METQKAKAVISISEGRFEFEGDEAFVASHLSKFEEAIKQALRLNPGPRGKSEEKQRQSPATAGERQSLSSYENLFAIADGKVQILKTLPGNSTAEKMVSAATLLAYANALTGQENTSFESVRALCKTHGCLDASNFAKTLKAQKGMFVFSGGTKSTSLSLTVPGRKKAEGIANSLNVP